MEDFIHIEDQFTQEEKLIRDSVKNFVQEAVLPDITRAFEDAIFLKEWIAGLAELGLFGMTLPDNYGGGAANTVSYGLACQELEYGDSALRSFVSVQNALCIYPIFQYGTDAQKRYFLPDMIKGKRIGCFGLTEPDTGSDPGNLRTTAHKVEGGWCLNGSKLWITNATLADLAIIWAQTEAGIRGFMVEKSFKGFSSHKTHQKMSLRASVTGELHFQNCFIPDDYYLPGTEKGLVAALHCLSQARFGIAWGAMGAAQACYNIALNYTKERFQFKRPLASFQLVQKDLVDMLTEICKAQTFNLHLARLKDKGELNFAMISMAKMNACREALKIARMARNLLGANGITLDYHVIRHMTNLESVFTYEGTDNIHHLIIGKAITGFNAIEE
jgi:glutaryl-CoA dehydrogenase